MLLERPAELAQEESNMTREKDGLFVTRTTWRNSHGQTHLSSCLPVGLTQRVGLIPVDLTQQMQRMGCRKGSLRWEGGGSRVAGGGGDDSVWIGTLDLGQVACPSLERRSLQLVSAVFVFKCLSWEYFFFALVSCFERRSLEALLSFSPKP